MYRFKLLILCFFAGAFTLTAADSSRMQKKPVYRNTLLLGFNYGRQIPAADMAKRFGGSNSIGVTLSYKFGSNWQVQAGLNTLFSGKVRENTMFDSIASDNGELIDNQGTSAQVRMYERGYHWHVDLGKVFPLGSFDRNSGLLFTLGAGFMEHKVKFTFQRTVLPQLEGDYYKGYDRLSNGFMLRGFIGYQRIDVKRSFSFLAGLEVLDGFTKSRRSFNYDTRTSDTRLRTDLLFGLKVGIMITLGGKTAGLKKNEEERYFE
jgi:hypothetical protein